MLIYTGPTALYKKGYIDFNPSKTFISTLHSGPMTAPKIRTLLGTDEYVLDHETAISFGKYKEKFVDDKVHYIYSDERLLAELDKWPLSYEMRSKAVNHLLKNIIEDRLVKVMHDLRKRRGYSYPLEAVKISQDYVKPLDVILKSNDIRNSLKSYLLKIFEDENIFVIVKGGTAIQVFWEKNRETIDIDLHSECHFIKEIDDKISNRKRPIRFTMHELIHKKGYETPGREITANNICKKKISKIAFVPKTYKGNSFTTDKYVKLSLNLTISGLQDMVNEFKITKRIYGEFKSKIFTFTLEQLLAEKLYSIVMKPEHTRRGKDLLDIYFLLNGEHDIDVPLFKKWFFKKSNIDSRKSFENDEQVVNAVKENMFKKLIKIEADWTKTTGQYDVVDITYEDAHSRYMDLINTLLK